MRLRSSPDRLGVVAAVLVAAAALVVACTAGVGAPGTSTSSSGTSGTSSGTSGTSGASASSSSGTSGASASSSSGASGTSGGTPVSAASFDQTCTLDTDCVAVWEGLSVGCCGCPSGAINKKDLSNYSAATKGWVSPDCSGLGCAGCVTPAPVQCKSGKCTSCQGPCPSNDGG